MLLIAVDRPLGAATVGDENEIVLRQNNAAFLALLTRLDGRRLLARALDVEDHIRHFHAKAEIDTRRFQIFLHRQDQRFVLVVARKFQRAEIWQPGDVVDESLEIELHLQRAVPVFKGEHRAPVEPEGRIKNFLVEHILDRLVVELFVRRHEKLHDLHRALGAETKSAIGVRILAAIFRGAAEGIVWILAIEPVEFIEYRRIVDFQRRNAAEKIPETFKMILHLAPAAHDVAAARVEDPIAGAASHIHRFENMDVFAWHLSVAHKEASCCQRRQSTANNIRVLVFHALRFFRTRKGFIVAVRVADALAVCRVAAQLCIAIFRHRWRDLFTGSAFLRQRHRCASPGSAQCRHSDLGMFVHNPSSFP